MTLDGVAGKILDLLRAMDAEAVPSSDGKPTGLNWYGGHIGTRQTEPAWSKRIAALLREAGFDASAECRYPAQGRERCDVVVAVPEVGKFWIEIKGAWKEWWRQKGKNDLIYHSYLLHPLLPGLDASKTHTVPYDILKLERLPREAAAAVGVLLIGFDSVDAPMDADVAQLAALSSVGKPPWTMVSREWPDPARPRQRVRCWFWYRRA